MTNAVIVDVVRTAVGKGKPGGALSGTHPVELLAHVLRSLVERNDIDPAQVDDVIGGCVAQVGEQSLNISRTALLAAGFPESCPRPPSTASADRASRPRTSPRRASSPVPTTWSSRAVSSR